MLNYVLKERRKTFLKCFLFHLHVHELSGRTAKKALLADSPIQGIGLQKNIIIYVKAKKSFFCNLKKFMSLVVEPLKRPCWRNISYFLHYYC